MLVNPRFRRAVGGRSNDVSRHVHSSGYARAAYGSRIGATSSEMFSDRVNADKNRRVVARYRHSRMGSQLSSSAARSVRRDDTNVSRGGVVGPRMVDTRPIAIPGTNENPGAQAKRPTNNSSQVSFTEPPARKYNPYA